MRAFGDELTASQLEEIQSWISDVNAAISDWVSIRAVRTTYDEIIQCQRSTRKALNNLANPTAFDVPSMIAAYANMEQRLSSFLFAASAFRDRTKTRLRERYGEKSENLAAFEDLQKSEYDKLFSYRLLYNVRNFAQHHAIPISLAEFSGKKNSDGAFEFYVKFSIYKNELLRSSLIQKSFRRVLVSSEEGEYDLISCCTEYMESYSRLAQSVLQEHEPAFDRFVTYVSKTFDFSNASHGEEPVIIDAVGTGDNLSIKIIRFPLSEIAHLRSFLPLTPEC